MSYYFILTTECSQKPVPFHSFLVIELPDILFVCLLFVQSPDRSLFNLNMEKSYWPKKEILKHHW